MTCTEKLIETSKEQLIDIFLACSDCEKHVGRHGTTFYSTCANIEYYILLCGKFDLQAKYNDGYYTAQGDGYKLDYIEGDVILVISK